MAFVEDLSVFFADFGVPAVVGVAPAVTVIFDKAYIAALMGRVESIGPECVGRTVDIGALEQGDPITIDGVAYSVTGNEPDGTGLSVLQLRG